MGELYLDIKNITGDARNKSGLLDTSKLLGNKVVGDFGYHYFNVTWTGSSGSASASIQTSIPGIGSINTQRGYITTPTTVSFTADLSSLKLPTTDIKESYTIRDETMSGNSLKMHDYVVANITNVEAEKPGELKILSEKRIYEDIVFEFSMISNNTCELELVQNDKLIYSKNFGTARRFTIPAGTIKTTQNVTVKIRSNCTLGGISATSAWTTFSLSGLEGLVAEKPNAITIGDNKVINKPIIFSVGIENTRDKIDFELYVGEDLVFSRANSSDRNITMPANTLKTIQNIKAKARSQISIAGLTSISEWLEVPVVGLEDNTPRILSLEPSDLDVNGLGQVKVSWYSQFQEVYDLRVRQGGKEVLNYSGSVIKEITIPPNTLILNAYVELILTIRNNTLNMGDSRTSRFYLYGNPIAPVLDSTTVYSTAKPTFTWQSMDQVAYQLQLHSNNALVEDSNEVIGTAKNYIFNATLTNNTTYILKARVKNKYGLWSEWVAKTIEIKYTEIPKPTFEITVDKVGGSITLTISNIYNDKFLDCEVYRKRKIDDEWIRIGYNIPKFYSLVDYAVAGDVLYEYKVRANDKSGGISESESKTAKIEVSHFQFLNVENVKDRITLVKDPSISFNIVRVIDTTVYAGNPKPTAETDGRSYKVFSMSFKVDYDEYELFNKLVSKSKVIMFRDRRRQFAYGHITSDIQVNYVQYISMYEIKFTFTETMFSEVDMYNGEGATGLAYFDGEYKFDGTIKWDGVAK